MEPEEYKGVRFTKYTINDYEYHMTFKNEKRAFEGYLQHPKKRKAKENLNPSNQFGLREYELYALSSL